MQAKDACDTQTESNKFTITCKTLTGNVHAVTNMRSAYTVSFFKQSYSSLTGTPVDQQVPIFNGERLQDDATLGECGLITDSDVCLILKFRGD